MAADLRMAISHPDGGFVVYPKDPEERDLEEEERRRRQEEEHRRMKRVLIALAVVGAALLIGAAGWYVSRTMNTFVMPSVVGQEQLLAQDAVERLNGAVELEYSYSEDYEQGIVMAQSRRAGARVKYDAPVVLTISQGTQWYHLENLTGQYADDAVEALRAQGVENVTVEYVQIDAAMNTVVSFTPQAGMQAKDTPVTLTVSGQRIPMPSLTGLTLEEARSLIEAEGLRLGDVTEGYAADAVPHTIVAQSVAAGDQVLTGTTVALTVSQEQTITHYPASKFSVVVPLNGSSVELTLRTPSGDALEVYKGVLNAGTYRMSLSSAETGVHTVEIRMDGVLMETQDIVFE